MRTRTGLLAIGGAIALTIGGSTAYAAIAASPVSSSGVISGCYSNAQVNGSHVFVLQDQNTCPKGSTPISWSQTGPAGAQGPQGIQGPQGLSGTNGIDGTSVLTSAAFPSNPCTSGDTGIDLADGEVYTCATTATDATPGWQDTESSIQGPPGPAGAIGPAGATGSTGPAGTGATVATEPPGNNCANGGVKVADGNNNTAYACTGATGPRLARAQCSPCRPGPTGRLGARRNALSLAAQVSA